MKQRSLFGWVAVFFLFISIVAWGDGETVLSWDPGTSQIGTAVVVTNSPVAGNYYKVTTQVTSNSLGCWRTVLNVSSGEADLYLRENSSLGLMS